MSEWIEMSGWIGVDFDGTIAKYGGWKDHTLGEPIMPMVERVQKWLADGQTVKIFTARMCEGDPEVEAMIKAWCKKHIGVELEVTNQKDYGMIALYDDRAVQVEFNTGRLVGQV